MAKKATKLALVKTEQISVKQQLNMQPRIIKPMTKAQKEVFEAYDNSDDHLLLMGSAGTGKSFVPLYLAIDELINDPEALFSKIIIIRSTVPTRDMGFLPGSVKEKTEIYEEPYKSIFNDIFGRGDAYEIMKKKGFVDFMPTSFVRGCSFNDALIIIDEIQNLNWPEIYTVLTRVGFNSRVILCGDFKQNDLVNTREFSGMGNLVRVADEMNSFKKIVFTPEDIVRSGFVKELIMTCERILD